MLPTLITGVLKRPRRRQGTPSNPEHPSQMTPTGTATDPRHDAVVLQALANEQTRLADALHDGALTQLVMARMAASEAARGNAAALSTLVERVDRVALELHALTGSLHEESLAERPLNEALEQIACALCGRVSVTLHLDPGAVGLHDDVLRQAARELLSNAVQHAGASNVTLTLSMLGDELQLQVDDDGNGMAPHARDRARATGHLGLQRLERTAARLGGGFFVEPNFPTGTTVTLRLPTGSPASSP
jgi:signal transduction histidine kinase